MVSLGREEGEEEEGGWDDSELGLTGGPGGEDEVKQRRAMAMLEQLMPLLDRLPDAPASSGKAGPCRPKGTAKAKGASAAKAGAKGAGPGKGKGAGAGRGSK